MPKRYDNLDFASGIFVVHPIKKFHSSLSIGCILIRHCASTLKICPLFSVSEEELQQNTATVEKIKNDFITIKNQDTNFWTQLYSGCQKHKFKRSQIEWLILFLKDHPDVTIDNIDEPDKDYKIRRIREQMKNSYPTPMTVFYKRDSLTNKSVAFAGPAPTFAKDWFGQKWVERSDDVTRITIPGLVGYFNSIHPESKQINILIIW